MSCTIAKSHTAIIFANKSFGISIDEMIPTATKFVMPTAARMDPEVRRCRRYRRRVNSFTATRITHSGGTSSAPATLGSTQETTSNTDGLQWFVSILHAKAELGYCLARQWWGRKIMSEVVPLLLDTLQRDPAVYRIWAVCHVDNIGSARLLERSGLSLEGRLARYGMFPNLTAEPQDVLLFAKALR
jgi:Acetyltransferase (GNAT) domain